MMKLDILLALLFLFVHKGTAFPLSPTPKLRKSALTTRPRRPVSRLRGSSSSSPWTWQSHVSTHAEHTKAVSKIFGDLNLSVAPDLAFLFVGQYHAKQFAAIVQQTWDGLPDKTRLLSVVGGGVIGEGMELDEPSKPCLSLMTGCLPTGLDDVEFFSFNELENPPPEPASKRWHSTFGDSDTPSSILVFADPWSPVEILLSRLGKESVIAGGVSVPTGAGPTVALDNSAQPQGSLVGVRFQKSLQLQVVVAQGCRPVSPVYTISSAEGSCILELDSQPAMRTLEHFLNGIESSDEQKQISSGIVCGIKAGEDFLIRQILGFVPQKGGIAVAGTIRAGEKLCFHVRDKDAAQEDLELMMARAKTERLFCGKSQGIPLAAIQISCVARGRYLFGVPNVDLSQTKQLLDGPVSGMYANGEIGPVGIAGFTSSVSDGTHLHGFTTIVALLSDMRAISDYDDSTSKSADESAGVWG